MVIITMLIPSHNQITSDHRILKEGNILFNDALNTFYLWLYGVGT